MAICSMVLEYLPSFALNITHMYVNIPYMEHMGWILMVSLGENEEKT